MDTQGFIGDNAGIGQGLAYVLPNSRTESYAIQLNQERAAQQRAEAALLEKQKEDQNNQYAQHLYANKIPEHNAQWDSAINPVFQKYIQDAADYHAKTGKDAFGTPEFVQRRNDLLNMAAKSNQSAKTAVGLSTLLNNDKDNKLNPDDKQRIAQALVAYNADPVKNADVLNGLTASAKPYDITDAQKLLKPTTLGTNDGYFDITKPDRHKHVVQAQEILSDPKFNQLKLKNGINPTVGDVFNIQDVNGTHYPTDEPTVRRFAQHILAAPALPGSAATLQAAGIDPADPNAEQKLTELGMKQNQGYGNLVSGLADYADARAKSDKKRVFTADNNDRSAMRLELAQAKADTANNDARAAQPVSMNIPYLNGKANVNANNYVPISVPNKNFAGVPAYSLTGGRQVKALESSGDYSVVGVGNFPFVNNKYQNTGTVAQPDFASNHPDGVDQKAMVHVQKKDDDGNLEDFLIPFNKLPENIKNSKPIKQALSNFKPASGTSQSVQSKTPTKLSTGSLNDL